MKIWKLGNKKPLKSIKFPTYIYSMNIVSDEFGVQYLVSSLAYDDTSKGDLLSVKLDTFQQFSYVKAHQGSIISLEPLKKFEKKILVSACIKGVIRIWRIGFNANSHLDPILTITGTPFINYQITENIEELLKSD